jgi:multidrug efflux pump subunit AcrA (membrane-fusion protein)
MKKVLFLSSLFILPFGCSKKEMTQPKIPVVKVVTVLPANISESIKLSGTVDSKSRAWLVSPADGVVISINKQEGDTVNKGDVVLSVMAVDYQNLLGLAKAEYEAAKKEFDNGNGDSQVLESARQRYESAKRLYKPFPVASPIDGTVIIRKVDIGENVSAKQNLMAIADIKNLVVKTAISERYYDKVFKGAKVKVKVEGRNSFFDGIISLVSPGINTDSRTFDVEIQLPQDLDLRPGMSAEIELPLVSKNNAVVLPQDALVVKPDGSKFVFIVEDSKAIMTKVETGIEANEKIEILKGVKFGQKVIIAGQENLKDGAKVKISETERKEGKSK